MAPGHSISARSTSGHSIRLGLLIIEFGDYQANGIMPLAKHLKTNPRELADQIIKELNSYNLNIVERFELAGPGFINIHLKNTQLVKRANAIINDELPLIPETEKLLRIAVDY